VLLLEDRAVPSITLGTNVPGLNYNTSSCNCEPPDPIAAAGPNHVVEMVNTAIQISDKTGHVLSTQSLASFFGPLAPANQSDPFVLFDEGVANASGPAGRFIVGVLDFPTQASANNYLDFAVSNDADPTHGFTKMQKLNVGEGNYSADYPRVGFNADAYIITMNMFTLRGFYSHPQILTIQKSTAIDGTNSALTFFQSDANSGLFTLAPALMHGSAAGGPAYLVTEGLTAGTLDVIRMTNVLSSTPTLTDNNLAVASYSAPPAANQPGGTITTNDSRVLNAAWRNNTLVADHTVGTGGTAHARWYQINTSGTPSLSQYGEIAPGSGVATYFPSIDIDANGDLGMTFMQSSSSQYISMYVTGRTPADAAGTMETPVLAAAGQVTYTGSRAGDFSGTSVDPATGTSFWSANEYIPSSAFWGTEVTNYSVSTVQPDHLSLSAPSSSTAGSPFTLTVTALTAANTTDTNYRGTIHFTSSDTRSGVVLPADYTFTAADNGVHTFTNGVTLVTAGNQTVTATDTVTAAITGSTSVTVTPAAATHLQVAAPSSVTSGVAFTVTVTALDPYNNIATGYLGIVNFTSTDTAATLPAPYAFTVADNGVHTFTNGVTLRTTGTQTITATDTVTTSITGSATVTVLAAVGPATHFQVVASASSVTAGSAFSITVTALDASNNIASGYSGTVHFTTSDTRSGVVLPADYTFTAADNGVHTFTNAVKLVTAGSQTVTATDTTTSSITGSTTVTVNPGAATHLAIAAPPSARINVPITITVTALDAYGNTATGYRGTIHFTSSIRKTTLPPNYTFTAADNGVHTFTNGVTFTRTGTATLTARDTVISSISGSVTFSVTTTHTGPSVWRFPRTDQAATRAANTLGAALAFSLPGWTRTFVTVEWLASASFEMARPALPATWVDQLFASQPGGGPDNVLAMPGSRARDVLSDILVADQGALSTDAVPLGLL
jgi:hypothetical protein